MTDRATQATLARGIVAGGMTLVGLATGSSPFFSLLLNASFNVGANLLSTMADRAFDNWRERWVGPDGVLDDHIRQVLKRAFTAAVQQLESDWQKHNYYHYLRLNNKHRANASLEVIQELRDDVDNIFDDRDQYTAILQNEKVFDLVGVTQPTEESARQFLEQTVDKYLALVPQLSEFGKKQIPDLWIAHFAQIIKSNEGTPAWRACQQLWQTSLITSVAQLQQGSDHLQDSVATMQQDVATIKTRLELWGQELRSLPDTVRDPVGEAALDYVLRIHLQIVHERLDTIEANTARIIALFQEKFTELDANQVMTNFLQKELLNDQYVNLEQAGHAADVEDISLAKVFVDLPVANEPTAEPPDETDSSEVQGSGIVSVIVNTATEELDPASQAVQASKQRGGKWSYDLKQNPGRFVIIGGPGQGKTTTSQFICQLFRAAILEPRTVHYTKTRQALREIRNACTEEGIEYPSVLRFPMRVVLSDFAAALASDQSPKINSLISYIVHRIRVRTDQEVTPDALRRWFAEYPWLIILDGLDEVPASSNRNAVLAAVDDFWIDVTDSNADVLVVATTRPQGYSREFAPNIYQHKWLVPLSKARAEHYAKRLVDLRYKQEQDRQQKVLFRLQRALEDESTVRLMRSPLQVTIMTSLVDKLGKPPQERWTLFQEYYNVIFSREMERPIPAAAILRDYRPDINAIHHRVGLLLQIESEHTGQTNARLSKERFASLVEARLADQGHQGQALTQLRDRIIAAATHRLVFLVGVEADEVGFEIRSLQEFMAAEALMQGGEAKIRMRLQEIAPISNWRNVFLFAAGSCFAKEDREHLREYVLGVCAKLNESGDGKDGVTHATLAGSQLALSLLEDGPARRQPLYASMLARLALRLTELPASDYHIELANLYDSGLADLFRESGTADVFHEELEERVQHNVAARSGVWATLLRMEDNGVSWAGELVNGHWPNDSAQQRQLIEVADQADKAAHVLVRLRSQLTDILSPREVALYGSFRSADERLSNRHKELAWLDEFVDAFTTPAPTMVALRIHSRPSIEEAFRVRMVRNRSLESLRALQDYIGSNAGWAPLEAAIHFEENPSHTVLANELRRIAHSFSAEDTKWALDLMPWPLAEVLQGATSPEQILEFASRVEEGQLGNVADWRAAEDRWMTHGVTDDDLRYSAACRLPFDDQIAQVGFPSQPLKRPLFPKLGLRSDEERAEVRPTIETLLLLLRQSNEARFRSLIGECIIWSLTVYAYNSRMTFQYGAARHRTSYAAKHPMMSDHRYFSSSMPSNSSAAIIRPDELIEVLSSSAQSVHRYLEVLETVDWTAIGEGEYLDLLDLFGRSSRRFSTLPLSASDTKYLVEPLARLLTEHPDKVGILPLLSILTEDGGRPSIPLFLLNPARYDDPHLGEAAIIVRLVQDSLTQEEGELLAHYSMSVAEDTPEFYDSLLTVVTEHKLSHSGSAAFLLKVLESLPKQEWKQRNTILSGLNDLLRRRTSRLNKRWSDLGLPRGLDDLIRTEPPT
jgi:hypothetical protein